MNAFLTHWLPVIITSLAVAFPTRRGVTRQLLAHATDVNRVIQWALQQEPPKNASGNTHDRTVQ